MRVMKWVPLLLLLAVLGVCALNYFDDPLDPGAAAAGQPRAPRVPEAQNGYYALLALGADDGADGMGYARAWLDEARAAAREHRAETNPPSRRAARPDLCDPMSTSCITAMRAEADKNAGETAGRTERALQAWHEDLTRYQALLASPAYEEVLDYPLRIQSRLPSYTALGMAQRAWLTRAALAAQAGDIEGAIAAVEKDVTFNHLMLEGSRTLIGRMVAAADYERDLAFVSDLLQSTVTDLKPLAPRLAALWKPLSPAALSLDTVFDSEFAAMKQALLEPGAADETGLRSMLEKIGMRTLYKPHQTVNVVYRQYRAVVENARKPPAALAADARETPSRTAEMTWWNYIENPVGNILLRAAMPSLSGYALRLHDLDAHQRLVALATEIVAADVPTEGIADFVAGADSRFSDPYTGKPMAWDPATRRLSFKRGQVNSREGYNVENGVVFVTM